MDNRKIRKTEKFKLAEAFLSKLVRTKPEKIEMLRKIQKLIESYFPTKKK